MSEHVWKIGDWAIDAYKPDQKEVVLVVNTWNDGTVTVCDGTTKGCYVIQVKYLQTAEGCTGYHWQPPATLQLKEGCWYLTDDGRTIGPCLPYSEDGDDEIKWKVGPYWYYDDGMTAALHLRIVREVPAPVPKYRPFKNAEEFKPYRDKWLKWKDNASTFRVHGQTQDCVVFGNGECKNFYAAFMHWEFEDGTPFGVKVDE